MTRRRRKKKPSLLHASFKNKQSKDWIGEESWGSTLLPVAVKCKARCVDKWLIHQAYLHHSGLFDRSIPHLHTTLNTANIHHWQYKHN